MSRLAWRRSLLVLLVLCPLATRCKPTGGQGHSGMGHNSTQQMRDIMRRAKAAEMRNFMRTSADPCDDFYTFACGNWAKINPAIKDPKTGIFSVLTKAYSRKIGRMLRSPKRSSDSAMERRVKYFYESCMNRDEEAPMERRKQLLSLMEEFGGMPALKGAQWQEEKFDWIDVVARILRKYGLQIIIGVDIAADLSNNEVNRLYIGEKEGLVPTRAKDYYASLKAFRQNDLHEQLGLAPQLASKTANDIVNFAQRLAEGIADLHEGLGIEDKTRLRLLDEMSEQYRPTLNFTRFVNTWLGWEYRLPVYEYVESYQRNLRHLIETTPKRVVANYIMWELVQHFNLDVEDNEQLQQLKCVDVTKKFFVKYLDNLLYRQLMRHHANTIEQIRQVWTELKAAFEETLQSNATAWLSESTRDKALEKLSAMTFMINSYENEDFDKEFGDLIISTESYFENVIRVLELRGRNYRFKLLEPPKLDDAALLSFSPAYVTEFNQVLIPVAFLQPYYLWHDVYPAALKYSTFGYVIAHELAHGFDDTIRKYDAKGNLNNWWDRQSSEEFAKRKQCLRQQFADFQYAGKPLQSSNAQGENIADNAAIRIAYAAYQNWLMQQHLEPANESVAVRNETLAGLDYTPHQLFFIGIAQLWCTDVQRRWRHTLSIIDEHAPEQVRVRAMLANFDEFAHEFKCARGSPMHPHRKCVVY